MIKVVDLFAGTGSFSLAFKNTGKAKAVFANDFVKESKIIYDANLDHPLTCEDIHTLSIEDIPKHDILTAGFSCTPFSLAGNKRGFDDDRSDVIWKMMDIIEYHKPKCVVMENVKNLVTHDGGKSLKKIIDSLEKLKYFVKYKILDTCKVTVFPQHRERIFIVGFLDKKRYDEFKFDFYCKSIFSVEFMLEEDVADKYYYTEKSAIYEKLKEAVVKKGVVYQYRRTYVRENKSGVCPTISYNMGSGGHNVPIVLDSKGIRKLTPRECFFLQGFPHDYILPKNLSDSKLYKLAGNAISYPVAFLLANKIVKTFY